MTTHILLIQFLCLVKCIRKQAKKKKKPDLAFFKLLTFLLEV